MPKRLKIIIALVAAIAIIAILHFVPVDSRSGYISASNGGCLDAPNPLNYNFRWIKGQVNDWDNQINYIHSKASGCDVAGRIRLYIL